MKASRILYAMAFLAGALACVVPARAESRVALVIGNGAYKNAGALRNPANDARRMSEALGKLGFEVLAFEDLDQAGMKRAVRDFAEKLEAAGRDTVGLVFYAGHGIQVNGVNYFIPVDAEIEKESDVAIESINAEDVMVALGNARNRLNIVILDACRNNPFARSFRSASRGLARLDAPVGSMVAFSTAPGQVAADGEGNNSPYTTALVDVLGQPGMKIEDVFKRVRERVYETSGGQQVPWESSSILGDFYFSGGAPGSDPFPGVTVTPPAEPEPASTQPGTDLASLRRFAESYLTTATVDASGRTALYAEEVEYFDRGVLTRDQILADKRDYYAKFPERHYLFDATSFRVGEQTDGGYTLSFSYGFTVANAEQRIEGRGETELGVRVDVGSILIVREQGRVTDKSVNTTAVAAASQMPRASTICADAPGGVAYCADSLLAPSDAADYGPWNLFDGKPATAWVEGESGTGVGQMLTLTYASERLLTALQITNGYNKSERLYTRNSRPKALRLIFADGTERTLTLEDRMGPQEHIIDPPVRARSVTVVIGSVYGGSKYNDTAISELGFAAVDP